MHDVIVPNTATYAYTWPGCYDGGLMVELCDVEKISSTEHFVDNH